jgi:hypothetical protein
MKTLVAYYEDYASPAAKRAAQVGAKRGQRTNKSNGYISVAWCNGMTHAADPCLDAIVSITARLPGEGPWAVACSGVSLSYLRANCRRIAKAQLPEDWAKALRWDDEKE